MRLEYEAYGGFQTASFLGISSGATARPASFSAQIELALLYRITKLKIYVSLVDKGNHRDIFL